MPGTVARIADTSGTAVVWATRSFWTSAGLFPKEASSVAAAARAVASLAATLPSTVAACVRVASVRRV